MDARLGLRVRSEQEPESAPAAASPTGEHREKTAAATRPSVPGKRRRRRESPTATPRPMRSDPSRKRLMIYGGAVLLTLSFAGYALRKAGQMDAEPSVPQDNWEVNVELGPGEAVDASQLAEKPAPSLDFAADASTAPPTATEPEESAENSASPSELSLHGPDGMPAAASPAANASAAESTPASSLLGSNAGQKPDAAAGDRQVALGEAAEVPPLTPAEAFGNPAEGTATLAQYPDTGYPLYRFDPLFAAAGAGHPDAVAGEDRAPGYVAADVPANAYNGARSANYAAESAYPRSQGYALPAAAMQPAGYHPSDAPAGYASPAYGAPASSNAAGYQAPAAGYPPAASYPSAGGMSAGLPGGYGQPAPTAPAAGFGGYSGGAQAPASQARLNGTIQSPQLR